MMDDLSQASPVKDENSLLLDEPTPDIINEMSDEWGSMLAKTDSWIEKRTYNRTRSTPIFTHSNSSSTWYTSPSWASSPPKKLWNTLGSTFRDWQADLHASGESSSGDHAHTRFLHGCVPNWQKMATVRLKQLIEHELAWAYYRMRRHADHPQREEVGDQLNQNAVIGAMRSGKNNSFQFWRDLRPPFSCIEVKRAQKDPEVIDGGGRPHPDGELYYVTYECPIEYTCERMWGLKSDGGTFNNKIHGVAQVRLPATFPEHRRMRVVGWGRPALNWSPKDMIVEEDEEDLPRAVDPAVWMSIATELGVRPDMKKLASCRKLTREASWKAHAQNKRGPEVPEMQKILLGPHASLPRLAAAEQRRINAAPTASALHQIRGGYQKPAFEGASSPMSKKKRQHTIYTASSGFVTYVG
eukprot:TRINITY_DN7217_c1_g1_i1.p1 TRINITY_DN7217_c1_g1~~TRINITY_DN7217_c1_g1_i1.p1  ORF type:complete len:412 (-),score=64.95 TRINITY_DN7217_c1_g1_i1:251-1486(-)